MAKVLQVAQLLSQRAHVAEVSEYCPSGQFAGQVVPPYTRRPVTQVRQDIAERQFPQGFWQLSQTGFPLESNLPYLPAPQFVVQVVKRR